jgi:hypothetical protein
MNDRIDHRAEAEALLTEVGGHLFHDSDYAAPAGICKALLGIGHALLATFPDDNGTDPFYDDDGGWEGLPTSAPVWQEDRRPHSRACGAHAHPHGPDCDRNCPTCGTFAPG